MHRQVIGTTSDGAVDRARMQLHAAAHLGERRLLHFFRRTVQRASRLDFRLGPAERFNLTSRTQRSGDRLLLRITSMHHLADVAADSFL